MAVAAVALPTFIHDDVPTQSLVDELRRLEGARAQIQAAHRRRGSDDTAFMLQYYGMELEEVGFIIRDRLWALILGRGEDADAARVQEFFRTLTTQIQIQIQAEITEPDDLTNELDEADIAALGLVFDDDPPVNGQAIHALAPPNPVVAPTSLPQLPPPAVLDPLIVFPAAVPDTPLEV